MYVPRGHTAGGDSVSYIDTTLPERAHVGLEVNDGFSQQKVE